MFATSLRFLPEIFGVLLVAACHRLLFQWAESRLSRGLVFASLAISVLSLLLNMPLGDLLPPGPPSQWVRGVGILWAMCLCGTTAALAVARSMGRNVSVDSGRRAVLRTAQTAVIGAPALVLGYGSFVERRMLAPREVKIAVAGLPKDLNGLRIALLSDIHMSTFISGSEVAAAVDMANSFRPHLTAVTGDLITRGGDPLDTCLDELKRLRAEAGVFGCMGNHEIYARCEGYVEAQAKRFGLNFLRGSAVTLPFGEARVRLAGVDYQKMHGEYLANAQALQEEGAFPLLLSHNPDVFETAAAQGWGLTLAGHTHGGQVTVEYLHQHLNVARFFTPYVYGHYQKENSHIYVTRGIGTVGVPARVGAVPEVALIQLCAT